MRWRVERSVPAVLGALVGLQGLGATWDSALMLSAGLALTFLVQALAAALVSRGTVRVHALGVLASSDKPGAPAYLVPLAAPLASGALGLLVFAPSPELKVLGAVGMAGAVLHLLPAWPLASGELLWVATRSRLTHPRAVARRSGLLIGAGLCLVGLASGVLFIALVGGVLLAANRPQRSRSTAPSMLPGAPA